MEPLERRNLLAIFTVNSASDAGDGDSDDGVCDTGNASDGFTGVCTLRAATITANHVAGLDRIHFSIPGPGIPTINVTTAANQFRTLTDPIVIDGTTQPAGMVEINGSAARDGFLFEVESSGSEVRGLIMNRFPETAIVLRANNALIAGNYFGTDSTGTITDPDEIPDNGDELGNGAAVHIVVRLENDDVLGGKNNTIGGTSAADRNVISGNATGVAIFSPANAGNRVLGNFIGTDVSGTQGISYGRGVGVRISSSGELPSSGNIVGGTEPGSANVIADGFGGVLVTGSDNRVENNLIGTDVTATDNLGNATFGVRVSSGTGNVIGGTAEGTGNTIVSNSPGIEITDLSSSNTVERNYIGTTATGTMLGNSIGISVVNSDGNILGGEFGNTISHSELDGVILAGAGATGNLVLGNRIGTDPSGMSAATNGRHGVYIVSASSNSVGASLPGGSPILGNIISANFEHGVAIGNGTAVNNVVQGNKIGTDVLGTGALGNGFEGVALLQGAANNTIGGTGNAGNLISGNIGDGILIIGTEEQPATGNFVEGNYIGTTIDGEGALPNEFRGIHIDAHARGNMIGGNTPGSRNIISGNALDGIVIALQGAEENVIKGNYIGTDKDGDTGLGNGGSGIFVFNAAKNIIGESDGTSFVRNVIADNAEHGIHIQGAESKENVVAGNLIGSNAAGSAELLNQKHGVSILDAPENRIGDVYAGDPADFNFPGNVIAAKDNGVRIQGADATGNLVLSNLIGVDRSGNTAWPTVATAGVLLLDAASNRVGVPADPAAGPGGNTISHSRIGVHIRSTIGAAGSGSTGNMVAGNRIGTAQNGDLGNPPTTLGNEEAGVLIDDFANNYIGGQPTGSPELPGNVIAGNAGEGIRIVGANAIGNTLQRNSIHSNGGLGIDLNADGITKNDDLDEDEGVNHLQNIPFAMPVMRPDGSRAVVGSLHSKPNMLYRIEFFDNETADSSRFGEGQTFINALDATTNADGNAFFTLPLATPLAGGVVTATATNTSGSTSEFSCAISEIGINNDGMVFGVTSTDDAGPGTLREAINRANSNTGKDVIVFCLPGTGTQTILLEEALPAISDPVIIDASTQNGAACNSMELESGSNAELLVELSGANMPMETHGLTILAGGSTVRGLVINRFSGSGIHIEQAGGNRIECSLLGTNTEGDAAFANGMGITIQDSADNLVGGTEADKRNVISGNSATGVAIKGEGATGNVVDGNLIGTNASGTSAVANVVGVQISDATQNFVGGVTGNVISGNSEDGVKINDTLVAGEAANNVVLNNLIGADVSGTTEVPNLRGVRILDAELNQVGGVPADSTELMGNVISGNTETGIIIAGIDARENIVQGNLIGTTVTGKQELPNGFDGVSLGAGSRSNRIGGTAPGAGNVVSGNLGDGIRLHGNEAFPATRNTIVGNYVGTDIDGEARLGNRGRGIYLSGTATRNVVGGTNGASRNIISANSKDGIFIEGTGADRTDVFGNYIGTDKDGTDDLGNLESGVYILNARRTDLGGESVTQGNVISGNKYGVYIKGAMADDNDVFGNLIGTDQNGTLPIGNDEDGILLEDVLAHQIGEKITKGNVISANKNGIHIKGSSENNSGQSNWIGTDPSGEDGLDPENRPLGNKQAGILITDAKNTTIGGATAVDAACSNPNFTENRIR